MSTIEAHGVHGCRDDEVRLVYVVGADAALRQELASALGGGFCCVSFADADAMLRRLPALRAGCIVTCQLRSAEGGHDLRQELLARDCVFPVVVVVGETEAQAAVEALKAGIADVVVRPIREDAMQEAIEGAMAQMQRTRENVSLTEDLHARLARLTRREREVLEAIVRGAANKAIAFQMGISPRTVEVHRAKVMEKLGTRSLPQIVRMAVAAGLGAPR